jgi:hypothetical protein
MELFINLPENLLRISTSSQIHSLCCLDDEPLIKRSAGSIEIHKVIEARQMISKSGPHKGCVMQVTEERDIRISVKRENIDPRGLDDFPASGSIVYPYAVVHDAAEISVVIFFDLEIQILKVLRKTFASRKEVEQSVIIFSGHADVHVIVPGNEAPVPYRAEHSAPDHVITQVLPLTDIDKNADDLKLCQLQFS